MGGITRRRKGADHTLAALKSIRATRPDGQQLYVILDNLSADKTPAIRRWATRNQVELCFTPTGASWANPIEAQFGPLRSFVLGGLDHPNHTVLARKLQGYLRCRNAGARHPACWPPNGASASASVANATNAGAAPAARRPDDPTYPSAQQTSLTEQALPIASGAVLTPTAAAGCTC